MDNHTISSGDSSIQWRDIPGFEGVYKVSDTGLVRRIKRTKRANQTSVLKPRSTLPGYQFVTLCVSSKEKNFLVHRLVLLAFLGKCPDGMEVNHLNGNRSDNHLKNLEYVTHYDNVQYTIHVLKNHRQGERVNGAVLNDNSVREIRRLYAAGGISQRKIGNMFNVHNSVISEIVNRKTWKHVK